MTVDEIMDIVYQRSIYDPVKVQEYVDALQSGKFSKFTKYQYWYILNNSIKLKSETVSGKTNCTGIVVLPNGENILQLTLMENLLKNHNSQIKKAVRGILFETKIPIPELEYRKKFITEARRLKLKELGF
jgi:hypothetical protein